MEYMRKLCSKENRFVSCVYMLSLALSVYMCFARDTGYIMSLGMLVFQLTALVWLGTVAVSGVDVANGWIYSMFAAQAVDKIKGALSRDKG